MQYLARAQGFQRTNMPSVERLIYSTPALSVLFFSIIERSVLMALVLLQRYVRKGNDAKNPAIFSFCLLPKEPS